MPNQTIWYISKYATPRESQGVGSRGCEMMEALAARGHRVTIITSDSNHLVDVPELNSSERIVEGHGLTLCWLRTYKATQAKSLGRILSWVHFEWRVLTFDKKQLRGRPDVIIVSSPSLLSVLSGYRLARHYEIPLIFEVRDIWPLTLTEEGGFSPRNPFIQLLRWIERFGYRRADAIVGTMPNLAQHVGASVGERTSVHCVPMGYSVPAPEPKVRLSRDYRSRYLDQSGMVVGYAGTIGATNALETLLMAARRLDGDSRVSFLVLGDGDLLEHFKHEFGDLQNLTFAPRVQKEAVSQVLAICDVLYFGVHPSRVWEFGQSLNKLIDYMLAGKPILASYSGFPSMIDEAGCGTFIPAGDVSALVDEIRRYARMEPHKRAEIGSRGRDWLLEYRSYSQLAERYEAIIDQAQQVE